MDDDLPFTQRWRFHRHFANNEVHRDGGPECTQPGTPRRVFVFDLEDLWEHDDLVRAMDEDGYAQYKEEGRSL
jgi:hypothetical protein